MIINEKYLMDIDDDDDNGIESGIFQHKYAHNIRIISEHNCREQNLDDWQFEFIGNIINMPIGKELVYNPKISFTNHEYVENYKALDDSKYKIETERTNGTITNLKIKRIA